MNKISNKASISRRRAAAMMAAGAVGMTVLPSCTDPATGGEVEADKSNERNTMSFTLPDLPYAHDALAPHIDPKTMEIHHGKHHAGYTKKLNAALEGHDELAGKGIVALLSDLDGLPDAVRTGVRNAGGGYFNHNLFWKVMSPDGGGAPTGKAAEAINSAFGSYDDFKTAFGTAAKGVWGSGWAWLAESPSGLKVVQTSNQDSPLSSGMNPILGIDVWEHAYYLNYQNRRADYVDAWFELINWDQVNENMG